MGLPPLLQIPWDQMCFEIENHRILKGSMVPTLNIYITPLERDGSLCKQKSTYFLSGTYEYSQ